MGKFDALVTTCDEHGFVSKLMSPALIFPALCKKLCQLVLALCACQQPPPNFLFCGQVLFNRMLHLLLNHGLHYWMVLVYIEYHINSVTSLASMKHLRRNTVRELMECMILTMAFHGINKRSTQMRGVLSRWHCSPGVSLEWLCCFFSLCSQHSPAPKVKDQEGGKECPTCPAFCSQQWEPCSRTPFGQLSRCSLCLSP